jgi:hypothetical protein
LAANLRKLDHNRSLQVSFLLLVLDRGETGELLYATSNIFS